MRIARIKEGNLKGELVEIIEETESSTTVRSLSDPTVTALIKPSSLEILKVLSWVVLRLIKLFRKRKK